MSKNGIHVHCKVQRGNAFMVTWLPKEFAVLGKVLRLRDREGTYTDGWVVINTWTESPTEQVLARAQDFKKHRAATDV